MWVVFTDRRGIKRDEASGDGIKPSRTEVHQACGRILRFADVPNRVGTVAVGGVAAVGARLVLYPLAKRAVVLSPCAVDLSD